MIFDGMHFSYGDFSSRRYGMVMSHLDTSENMSLIGGTSTSTVFNRRNNKRYFIGDEYVNSAVEYEAEITCYDQDYLLPEDQHQVEKELFYSQTYKKMFFDMADDINSETYGFVDGDVKRYYLNCRMTNMSRIQDGANHTVGYKFTLECDMCMFHQEPVIKSFELDHESASTSSTLIINVDSDMKDFVYPKITVEMKSGGGLLTISNQTDDTSRLTKFSGLNSSETIVIDGRTNSVYEVTSESTPDNVYVKFVDRNFARLVDGNNSISVQGNVNTISFEFENYKYL